MLALDDLDLLDAELWDGALVGFNMEDEIKRAREQSQSYSATLQVDKKWRGDDAKGNGVYFLHATGDASAFHPGSPLYTPDHIIWDVVSIDPDKRGLTTSKKRSEVSLTAWLFGDWSTLTGDYSVTMSHTPAMRAAEVAEEGKKALGAGWSYLPWIIGGVVVIGLGTVVAPLVVPLLAARRLAR